MSKKFLFVLATKKEESEVETLPIFKSFKLMNLTESGIVDTKIFFNNDRGLSELYNSILDDTTYTNEYDYIIFLHDDIWINDVFIFDKIDKLSENGDIIGVCGGKAWSTKGMNKSMPIIWTRASQSKGMSGFMIHAPQASFYKPQRDCFYDNKTFFSSGYGDSPSQVLTIDGCFMCFTKNAIAKGVRFDNQFDFHFYDIDMCFSAYVKNIKITTAPILLSHESMGYSALQPEFMEAQEKFLKKWFSEE